MGCSGRYATVVEYNDMLGAGIDLEDPSQVNHVETYLDLAAADIHAALASVGACDCTLASWATSLMKKLNIIDAAIIHLAPCGNSMTDEQRRAFMEWIGKVFDDLVSGKLVVCQGETGSNYPAFGIAEINLTDWSDAEIRLNALLRSL